MKIFVLIPAYNEAKKIYQVVSNVQKFCSKVIVIDDGSFDQTFAKARQAGAVVLRHLVNRGQGAALQTGMEYALENQADIIVHFDADGQHRAEDIVPLIKPIKLARAEAVLGSRFLISNFKFLHQKRANTSKTYQPVADNQYQINKIPLTKRIVLKLALAHQWFFTGLKVTDSHCGLRAFSREAAKKIKINQNRMAHASEILEQIAEHHLKYQEVPVKIKYSKYSLKKGQKNFLGSLRILYDFFISRLL